MRPSLLNFLGPETDGENACEGGVFMVLKLGGRTRLFYILIPKKMMAKNHQKTTPKMLIDYRGMIFFRVCVKDVL